MYKVTLVLLLALFAVSQGAITQLKILNCSCISGNQYCTYQQMGYGTVYKSYSGGSVGYCVEVGRILQGSTIVGFKYRCPLSSTSGVFTITAGTGSNICGLTYDSITITSCVAGNPCSNSG